MNTLKIDDAVASVFEKHGVEMPVNELEFRIDLANSLNKVINQYNVDLSNTVEEAKSEVFSEENFKNGSKCPVCERHVQMRKYTLSDLQLVSLIRLYKLQKESGNAKKYFHVQDDVDVPLKVGGDWAKLRHWGLIEECLKAEADDKPRSGYWRMTAEGNLFCDNQLSIPRYITIYNSEFRGYYDSEDLISISNVFAKRKKFNYKEVKQWSFSDWNENIKAAN